MYRGYLYIIGLIIIATALMITGGFWFESIQCENRWQDRDSEFSVTTGCLVEYEGVMVPEDRVWFERNR